MAVTPEQLDAVSLGLGIKLLDWQKELIWDRTITRWCLNNGRKTGKSTALEGRAAMQLINDSVPGSGKSGGICIISKNQRDARDLLTGVKNLLNEFGWAFCRHRPGMNLAENIAFGSSTEITMPGTSNRLLALPAGATGDGIRPMSFHCIMYDEADFIPETVYTSTAACLARYEGVEILTSTPNPAADKGSYFARAFFGKSTGYKVYEIPTASVPHVSASWLKEQREKMDAASYQREFECRFSENAANVFDQELCFSCTAKGKVDWNELERIAENIYIGVSLARMGEKYTIFAFNYHQDDISHIKLKIFENAKITEVEAALENLLRSNGRILKVCMDELAIGGGPSEYLCEHFGINRVVNVLNHQRVYDVEGARSRYMVEELFTNFIRLMERKKIIFEDECSMKIIGSLMNLRYQYRSSGQLSIFGREDEIAQAVARAVFPIWANSVWRGSVEGAIQSF